MSSIELHIHPTSEPNLIKYWTKNGIKHRTDGPAITYADGSYWIYHEGKMKEVKSFYSGKWIHDIVENGFVIKRDIS